MALSSSAVGMRIVERLEIFDIIFDIVFHLSTIGTAQADDPFALRLGQQMPRSTGFRFAERAQSFATRRTQTVHQPTPVRLPSQGRLP